MLTSHSPNTYMVVVFEVYIEVNTIVATAYMLSRMALAMEQS